MSDFPAGVPPELAHVLGKHQAIHSRMQELREKAETTELAYHERRRWADHAREEIRRAVFFQPAAMKIEEDAHGRGQEPTAERFAVAWAERLVGVCGLIAAVLDPAPRMSEWTRDTDERRLAVVLLETTFHAQAAEAVAPVLLRVQETSTLCGDIRRELWILLDDLAQSAVTPTLAPRDEASREWILAQQEDFRRRYGGFLEPPSQEHAERPAELEAEPPTSPAGAEDGPKLKLIPGGFSYGLHFSATFYISDHSCR